MQKLTNKPFFLFALSFLAGAMVTILSGLYTGFHVAGNDFWSLLYYGRHISWGEKESLYNGFYPIGYAFLIGQFPYGYAIQLSYLTNALLAGLLIAFISSLVFATRSILAAFLAFAFSVTIPAIFVYSNTVGPDIGTAAFTAFAVYLLWRDLLAGKGKSDSILKAVLIGVSLGLAALWRSHAIVSSVVILSVYFLTTGFRPLRPKLIIVGFFLGVFCLQVLANLLSGHGLYETAQNFNIYKLLHPIDWTHPPSPAEIEKFSLLETFRNDPQTVLDAYLPWFQFLVSFAWPGALCVLIAPWKSPISKYGLFTAPVIVLYAIPLALGDSLRAQVTIMGLFLSSLALGVVALITRVRSLTDSKKWLPPVVMALIFAASLYPISQWVIADRAFLAENRAEHRVFVSIEQVLLARGLTSPDQAFADRLDFYFPDLPPYLPRQIESFFNDWVWGYSDEYIPLPNDSWETFATACREQDIRFLVLSPNSAYRGDFFLPIYESKFDPDMLGLTFIAQRGKTRIYRFK
ncbi:MAG: hypothetical protein A2W36_06710 [Chloroflexi bacterium RBG_16_58_14]|nr:MAG: hypothetical protein A2W36_06710 [Chloroflexi bacterium RBG_16_58_14]